MLKSYDDLLGEVMPYVPGCPDMTALNAIRNAAIDLFQRSLVWQVLSDEDVLSLGDDAYEIDTPEQGELMHIMEVWIDGMNIPPSPPDQLRFQQPGAWPTNIGTPRSWIYQNGVIRFIPIPDKAFKIVTRAAFNPTLDSTGIEESLYRSYWPALRAGALARLQEIPGQTWTNEKQALLNMKKFDSGVGNAKIDANRGRTRAELTMELPRFV